MALTDTSHATYACLPCRTLKRKCTRELPVCSLCVRLNKVCDYTATNTHRGGSAAQVEIPERDTGFYARDSIPPNVSGLSSFPANFFLDSESHQQLSESNRTSTTVSPKGLEFLDTPEDCFVICNEYFASIQPWLPFMSEKRLARRLDNGRPETDLGLALRLTCMKLSSMSPSTWEEALSFPLYHKAKALLSLAETACLVCLDLVQAALLIAVYEIGHGIQPAAYLSISHAARLGIVLGLHDREHAPQLFKPPDTWTLREEERRTWWAIIILDRFSNIGITGTPLSTPEPANGTLLPCPDDAWTHGQISTNEPLFVESLSTTTPLGVYANTCQAAHITGRVLAHRNIHAINGASDLRAHLLEGQTLHQLLTSLITHLLHKHQETRSNSVENRLMALSLAVSAQLILCNIYACNEHYPPPDQAHLVEERIMQEAALKGIELMINAGFEIAQMVMSFDERGVTAVSPVVAHALYQAVTECAWVIREFGDQEHKVRLEVMIEALRVVSGRWRVVEKYMKLLRDEGTPGL
ncbi:hypothetical protein BJY04DRAFT_225143 [Aspergillus karnatakaensis]|uniref:Zn(II)2Cys6 transcription factor n=1 Tax=Aspergillus karnatakaensis TaxID=1810916 RepID=UPI003CCD2CF8